MLVNKQSEALVEQRTIIFLHIPKTAGLTLYDVMNREYGRSNIFTFEGGRQRLKESIERFKRLSMVDRARYRLLRGHAPFGLHELLPNPYAYITVLRDPVARVISHYYYIRRNPRHALHDQVTGMTLKAYVTSNLTTELDNDQTRLMAGVGDSIEFGQCSPALLDQAKANADRYFLAVGVAERFDETLMVMKRTLQWQRFPLYTRQNVSRHKPYAADVSSKTRCLIEKYNELDCELYAYAWKRFEKDVAMIEEREAKLFHLLNAAYYPYGRAYSTLRAAVRKLRAS
jgi:hypothetical protein